VGKGVQAKGGERGGALLGRIKRFMFTKKKGGFLRRGLSIGPVRGTNLTAWRRVGQGKGRREKKRYTRTHRKGERVKFKIGQKGETPMVVKAIQGVWQACHPREKRS